MLRISSPVVVRYSSSAVPLAFMSELPHTVWCEFASQPITRCSPLAAQWSISDLSSLESGGSPESYGRYAEQITSSDVFPPRLSFTLTAERSPVQNSFNFRVVILLLTKMQAVGLVDVVS